MISIQQKFQNLTKKIYNIAKLYNRDPKEINILAVSKNQPLSNIEKIASLGHISFGENYVQESIKKIKLIQTFYSNLEWHFIGPLQSNKSRLVAENFSWCHTVDRMRIANRLNEQRPIFLPPLNVLIQINISREENKSGIMAENIFNMVGQIQSLSRLKLRGIMAIPKLDDNFDRQLTVYNKMAITFQHLKKNFNNIDTLSLGTTHDIEAAIATGSTMLRIGTAIFGDRNNFKTYKNNL
ncbi:YggS family pyridoxal phosphate-dependent enzyme [Candidatus Pantoea edessiphila]|uniref:Pyridoxal phosphate homeostasis protein n=1 Tax=Candidatus Pantoea edessiphila TaxID=2044610 RepID=A0A2P5T1P3_9GAMM|nr:YggS family pyridoxal phosphate-dependent enzyme [Candidatus Pantoea edessiphila]PPI88519.1 YggS family pyridoxal phosphate-dependent enzyme [Candidatus Pantoea edessiphila]